MESGTHGLKATPDGWLNRYCQHDREHKETPSRTVGLGLQLAFADVTGWDTHVNQGSSEGQLAARLADFGQALAAFAQDLGERLREVVVLTMSEFGRTVRENGNSGTDHGHA